MQMFKNTLLVFSLLGASGSPFLRNEPCPRATHHRGSFLRSHASISASGVALGREALALARSGAEAQAVAALAEAFRSGEAPEIGVKCGERCRRPAPSSPYPTLAPLSSHRLAPLSHAAVNQVLAALGDAGHLDAAVASYDAMRNQHRVVPTVVTFGTIIGRAAKARRPELALRVWHDMTEAGVRPDVPATNALLNAYAKAATADDGNSTEWADRAVQMLKGMRGSESPLTPNIITSDTPPSP